jgi:hypothetical protein
MLDVDVTTLGKAKSLINNEKTKIRKSRKKSPIIQEYEGYLMKLERGKAITLTLKEEDIYQTIKYRFNKAAKYLGINNLKIEHSGNKVICYREVKPRGIKFVQDKILLDNVYEEPGEEQYPEEAESEAEHDIEPAITDESDSEPTMETDTPDDSPPASQPDSISDVEELLVFDFDEEWEVPMIYGHKTCVHSHQG